MHPRTSVVNKIDVNVILLGSVIEIGDTDFVEPNAEVFAIQREYPIFYGNEGSYDTYATFRIPLLKANIYESITASHYHENPFIKVNLLNVVGVSAGAYVQIGSTKTINAEGRVANVRHYFFPPENFPLSEFHPSSRGI
jgi:spore germination protein PE